MYFYTPIKSFSTYMVSLYIILEFEFINSVTFLYNNKKREHLSGVACQSRNMNIFEYNMPIFYNII